MKNILIIGSGELGSRHLQALAKTNININIQVVDPSNESLKIASERFKELPENKNVNSVNFFNEIDAIFDQIDLVIISTSSNVRSNVIKEILKKRHVKNIVLEKVLFQTVREYQEITELFKSFEIKCWVNHPRRMYPVYKNLRKVLSESSHIHMSVQGGDWGLACNGLHYIDIFLHLINSNNIDLNSSNLDNQILESKRKGFIEVSGSITGKSKQSTLSLTCINSYTPTIITINSPEIYLIINESLNEISIAKKNEGWKFKTYSEKIVYYQSELSNIFMEEILINDKCCLTTYEHSVLPHVEFIKNILYQINKNSNEEQTVCKIT